MSRIHVVTPAKTHEEPLPRGYSGEGEAHTYVPAEKFPLRLHEIRLGAGEEITVGPMDTGSIGYVWHGAASAGGHDLASGSSFVVERGEHLRVTGKSERCDLLLFSASQNSGQAEAGGHVHILPNEIVPRDSGLTATGVSGGMHADSQCPTCSVWLHENGFPGAEPASPEEQAVGVHSHSEDEIIFIVSGEIRLGRKLFPEGTAIAIPADTLYSFTPGPDGMRFINFRAAQPSDIHFANGNVMNEVEYWRDKLPRPQYLEPVD